MYRSLLAAALVPLALGNLPSSEPTTAPTSSEPTSVQTAQPTLEVCPVLVGLDASECPLGFLNETYPACNSTGLVLGERCWAIVPDDPDQPPTCGDEPQTDCAYTGPPFDDTQRRRLSISSGPGVYTANGTNPTAAPTVTDAPTTTNAPTRTETYAPTRMTEAPSYAPTTDTYAPTMAPACVEIKFILNRRVDLHAIDDPTHWLISTQAPTATEAPTPNATMSEAPTTAPTAEPSSKPTAEPTAGPTAEPSPSPTAEPSSKPTAEPTAGPTPAPTPAPVIVRRRLMDKVHGPVTRAFHAWQQRHFAKAE